MRLSGKLLQDTRQVLESGYQHELYQQFQDQAARNWNQLHTALSDMIIVKQYMVNLTIGGASSTLSRKEQTASYNYCRENSKAHQVAPRMTREEPYLYCNLSYTVFISPQCRIPWTCCPRKGGVKEMPVQSDSITYRINDMRPWKDQN